MNMEGLVQGDEGKEGDAFFVASLTITRPLRAVTGQSDSSAGHSH